MKNAAVKIDGVNASMACIIAMAADLGIMRSEGDCKFEFDPSVVAVINDDMSEIYPLSMEARVHIAERSMVDKYVGMWKGIKIYLPDFQ